MKDESAEGDVAWRSGHIAVFRQATRMVSRGAARRPLRSLARDEITVGGRFGSEKNNEPNDSAEIDDLDILVW